jgi:hypothetical protein
VAGNRLFLLNSSEDKTIAQNFPPTASAPKSQNAGGSEKSLPPRMESRSPCASRSSTHTGVIVGRLLSPFRKFLSYLWSKSAFNNPTLERTSFGWRKRA